MKIRLNGPAGQVDVVVGLLRQALLNVELFGPYADRTGDAVRVYLTGDLPADVASQMLPLVGHLREQALQAAWPDGVDLPARLLQTGDQALTAHGWELVDELHVDATAPHRTDSVAVYTTGMDSDTDPYPHHLDAPIRVRRQPEEGAR